MITQSEQELKPVEILDKRDGAVLVLLRRNIKKSAATKATKTEPAKPETWETKWEGIDSQEVGLEAAIL